MSAMRSMVSVMCGLAAGTALAAAAQAAMAETNVLPGDVTSTTLIGTQGTLRSATWSGPPSTPSNPATVYDGVFAPESQQWNDGSFWWDAEGPGNTPTMSDLNPPPVSLTLNLNHSYMIDHLTIQADDNDEYLVEYWTGSAWQTAWDAPLAGSFGLSTRSSGLLTPFVTDKIRIAGGPISDDYYAVSELQAFGVEVPEPATWAMMLLGVAVIGAGMRMQRKAALAA